MCLGIPGLVTRIWQEDGTPMANADFAGTMRKICLAYLPDLAVGEYVISHMGYALTRINAADAATTIAMMRKHGTLDQSGRRAPARPGKPAGPAGPAGPSEPTGSERAP